jgi:hypothetical protein
LAKCGTTTSAIQSITRRYWRLTSAGTNVSAPEPLQIVRIRKRTRVGAIAVNDPSAFVFVGEIRKFGGPFTSTAMGTRGSTAPAASSATIFSLVRTKGSPTRSRSRKLRAQAHDFCGACFRTDFWQFGHRKHSIGDVDAIGGRLRRKALAYGDMARAALQSLTARNRHRCAENGYCDDDPTEPARQLSRR